MEQLTWYRRQVDDGLMNFVTSRGDLPDASDATATVGPLRFILLMEGADAFRSPADVAEWYEHGLRIVGLSWRQNRMAGGTGFPRAAHRRGPRDRARARQGRHHPRHVPPRRRLVLGAARSRRRPGHREPFQLPRDRAGDRQISDEMIRALAQRDAVIGINFYDEFLLPPEQYKKRKCRMSDLTDHAKRLADVTGGAKYVALGTDMDGGVGRDDIPFEMSTAADLPVVADHCAPRVRRRGRARHDERELAAVFPPALPGRARLCRPFLARKPLSGTSRAKVSDERPRAREVVAQVRALLHVVLVHAVVEARGVNHVPPPIEMPTWLILRCSPGEEQQVAGLEVLLDRSAGGELEIGVARDGVTREFCGRVGPSGADRCRSGSRRPRGSKRRGSSGRRRSSACGRRRAGAAGNRADGDTVAAASRPTTSRRRILQTRSRARRA
jgi:hypothetical protein